MDLILLPLTPRWDDQLIREGGGLWLDFEWTFVKHMWSDS